MMAKQLKSFFIGIVVLAFLIVGPTSATATTSWNTPQEISAPSSNNSGPQIATDTSGHFITLFLAIVGSNYEMRSTSSVDFGATWSSPTTISSVGTSSLNPRILSTGPGSFVAVWNQYDGTTNQVVFAKTTNSGQTWTTPVRISTAGQNTRVADIAFDGQNSLAVVWTRQLSGFTYTVSASGSSDLGNTWATQQDLNSTSPGSIEPQIASNGTGLFVALWHRTSSPVVVESSVTTNSGSTWASPVTASVGSISSTFPQLVGVSGNKIVATWLQNISSITVVSSSVSTNNGASWSTPVTMSNPSSNATEAQLLRTPAGTLVSVWYQDLGSGNQIFSSRSTDEGLNWSTPTAVSSPNDAYNPRIASDSASNVTVAWWSGQGASSTIFVSSSNDAAQSWAPATAITQSPLTGNFVSIAVSPAGDKTVAWQSNYSGSLYKVYASSFIVSTVPPEPQPNTLPPTGLSSDFGLLSVCLIAGGILFLALRKRHAELSN